MGTKQQYVALHVGAALALIGTLPSHAQSPAPNAAETTPEIAEPAASVIEPNAAPETAPAAAAEAAATPAAAEPAAAAPADAARDFGGPEEVIVTARRVQERLQDVPISITVFNQDQLTERNVVSGRDLATYTPSLSANARYGTENTTFAIRGFSQESRTTASVGVFFADVVAPRGGASSTATGDGAGPGSFFDLANVQVLKGPQGTLFGRNTTGGAVLLVPQKPTSQLEGYIEDSRGNYDMRRLQGVLNIPLNDSVRLRFGGDWNQRAGYTKNVSGIGPDAYADTDYLALRASLVIDLAANVENYTIASYSKSENNGVAFQIGKCNPDVGPGVTQVFSTMACDQLARQQNYGKFDVEGFNDDPRSFLRTWQLINTTTWNATDELTVRNIASYSELLNKTRAELFGSAWVLPDTVQPSANNPPISTGQYAGTQFGFNTYRYAPGTSNANQSNFTEELQLQGKWGDLDWQSGVYLELSDPIKDNAVISVSRLHCDDYASFKCTDVAAESQNVNAALGSVTSQRYNTEYRNYGVYTQSTYRFNEQFSLTGGLRYTWDKVNSYGQNVQYSFLDPNVPVGICANPLVRPGVPARTPITSPSECDDNVTAKSDAPTWLVDFDYKPIDDLLLYLKYARGYRQGNTNPLGAGGFTTYGPEQVDSYEFGSKLSWHGAMPGNFNIALFYNDFQDQQLSMALLSSTNAPPNQAIVNVGKSAIKGFEVEAGVRPFAGTKVTLSYAYLDTKLKSVTTPVFPEGSPYDSFVPLTVGRELPYTPKNKLALSADYALPVPASLGDIIAGLSYSYTSNQTALYSAYGGLPSFELLNATLSWKSVAQSSFDIALFATNLTNEKYATNVNDFYAVANARFVSYLYGEPRMVGARLRWTFGG